MVLWGMGEGSRPTNISLILSLRIENVGFHVLCLHPIRRGFTFREQWGGGGGGVATQENMY